MKDQPAFLFEHEFNEGKISTEGMTLRDYFAAKEKHSLNISYYSSASFNSIVNNQAKERGLSIGEMLSVMAYESANDMLEVREQNK